MSSFMLGGEVPSKLLLKHLLGLLRHAGGRCFNTDGINLHGGGRLRWIGGKGGVGETLVTILGIHRIEAKH